MTLAPGAERPDSPGKVLPGSQSRHRRRLEAKKHLLWVYSRRWEEAAQGGRWGGNPLAGGVSYCSVTLDTVGPLASPAHCQQQPEGPGEADDQGGAGVGWGVTLEARFSTSATMEFLKRVAAVRGRLVTSVMLTSPSGHMSLRTGSVLGRDRQGA